MIERDKRDRERHTAHLCFSGETKHRQLFTPSPSPYSHLATVTWLTLTIYICVAHVLHFDTVLALAWLKANAIAVVLFVCIVEPVRAVMIEYMAELLRLWARTPLGRPNVRLPPTVPLGRVRCRAGGRDARAEGKEAEREDG
jgi:hypothetical protein